MCWRTLKAYLFIRVRNPFLSALMVFDSVHSIMQYYILYLACAWICLFVIYRYIEAIEFIPFPFKSMMYILILYE